MFCRPDPNGALVKLAAHFDTLLTDRVNLSASRLQSLENRAGSIYAALNRDETLGPMVHDMSQQGSWAQKTIINPSGGRDFDADFTLHLADDSSWTPKDYLNATRKALNDHHDYTGMTLNRKTRCVRVLYANDFHVDVVPSIERGGVRHIANYDDNIWEPTNPSGFTTWMQAKDADTHGNLRKVIRLFKWVRDNRNSFNGVRSILLTTMLGDRVSSANEIHDSGYYADLPSSFFHLVNDLDAYVWARENKPSVTDPSGTGLTFDHRWTQETYANFRQRLHTIADTTTQAYESTDKDESVELWQSLFGPGFKEAGVSTGRQRFGKPEESAASSFIAGRAG
uniref:SMODS domain-containing nucleotidyltransferase n=1 Tax=Curtobacterium poinsettiae TaxID=159612 RepID=UPI0026D7B15E|nr:nucleotidyltransferase [Curtobacterium flaccumfaciens]WQM79541.1 hypothetical protein PCFP31_535 [Curtobacterium flaccumfaciens pv. poinsettiae]